MWRIQGRCTSVTASALGVLMLAAQSCADATPDSRIATPFPSIVLNTQDPAVVDQGFTAVDATPAQLQHLPEGLPALVWFGGYDDDVCTMARPDAEVREQFARYGLADDARVLGYFLADEPNTDGNCPQASRQVRERAELVRSLDPDPAHITLVNVDDPEQFASFRDSADVLSTDPYPCATDSACDWTMIPAYVERLRAAGVTRYMGMLQAFSGDSWRWPTAAELQRMIEQWRRSDWCGALTFSWSYRDSRLVERPDLLAVLRDFNSAPPTPAPHCS